MFVKECLDCRPEVFFGDPAAGTCIVCFNPLFPTLQEDIVLRRILCDILVVCCDSIVLISKASCLKHCEADAVVAT